MAVSASAFVATNPGTDRLITGVRNSRRLEIVESSGLTGQMGDRDLDAIVATLNLVSDSTMVVVNIVSADLQTYAAEVGVGAACTTVPDAVSFCAEVVETGRPLTVSDAIAHPVYSRNPLVVAGAIGAYAGVPLIDNGVVMGSVAIFDDHAREFSEDVLDILRYQGTLAGTVLALHRSARMDALTGLPNRALFHDRLAGAVARLDRGGPAIAIMFLDLNGFKQINDSRGHMIGDDALVEFSERVTNAVRSADTVSRFGGDEFVILCENLASVRDAELIAQRVLTAVGEPWTLKGQSMTVTVSIGIALTDDAHAEVDDLIRRADAAMYEAKKLPGSAVVIARDDDARL